MLLKLSFKPHGMVSRCPCRITPFLCFLCIFFLPLFCHFCHNAGDPFVENTQTHRRAPETTASSFTSPLTVWLCSSIFQLQETTACSCSQKSFWPPFNFMKKSSDSSGVKILCVYIFHVHFFIYIYMALKRNAVHYPHSPTIPTDTDICWFIITERGRK